MVTTQQKPTVDLQERGAKIHHYKQPSIHKERHQKREKIKLQNNQKTIRHY